jgi:hypothetical protein
VTATTVALVVIVPTTVLLAIVVDVAVIITWARGFPTARRKL